MPSIKSLSTTASREESSSTNNKKSVSFRRLSARLSSNNTTNMGTAPPSKPISRPFRKPKPQWTRTKSHSTLLLKLITRRDWQKVLIRINLYKTEVCLPCCMSWYGREWNLLPLHLVVSLQPPPTVVQHMLLSSSTIQQCHVYMMKKQQKLKNSKQQKRKSRFGVLFPNNNNNNKQSNNNNATTTTNLPHDKTQEESSDDDEEYETEASHQVVVGGASAISSSHVLSSSTSSSIGDHATAGDTATASTYNEQEEEEELEDRSRASTSSSSEEEMEDYVVERSTGMQEAGMVATESFSSSSSSSSEDEESLANSSLSTKEDEEEYQDNDEQPAALQLGPKDGTVKSYPAPRNTKPEQAPTSSSRMEYDLNPLLEEADALLPLHVACLYRASPEVLQLLIDANPTATRITCLGMLPIHMVAAGFDLPPVIQAPPSSFPHLVIFKEEYKLAECLQVLAQHSPDTLQIASERNGMTPIEYLEETMDEGEYKRHCIGVLEEIAAQHQARLVAMTDDNSGVSSSGTPEDSNRRTKSYIPSEIMCDESATLPLHDDTSSAENVSDLVPELQSRQGKSPLYSLMLAKEWKFAFLVVEQDPEQACEWQYGIEMDQFGDSDEPQLYKRLPIHHACALHAPVGLLEALFQANPKGLTSEDPYTGDLPLHLACRHDAPVELVDSLLRAHPRASKRVDKDGRIPLHWACIAGCSLDVMQSLIKVYPNSVSVMDNRKMTALDYAKLNDDLEDQTVVFLKRIRKILDKAKTRNESSFSVLDAIEEEQNSREPSLCGESSDGSICEMLRNV